MNQIFKMLIFFGVIGTFIGGLLGVFFAKRTQKSIGILLGFTAGIMIGIVLIDVLPKMIVEYDFWKVICYLILGVILTKLLDETLEDLLLSKIKSNFLDNKLLYTGFLMFFVLALHNIPEGIALASSAVFDQRMGLSMGLVIAFHDVPEGMAVSGPLVASGYKKKKAFFYTLLTSLFTLFGSLIGLVLGGFVKELIYISLILSSSAMLYVSFKNLIPRSLDLINEWILTLMIIIGIICSLVIIKL